MMVMDKAGREVDVGGAVWVLYSALDRYVIDWTEVAHLPDFLVAGLRRYAVRLIRRGAPSCVYSFFRGTVCKLLLCPSAQRPVQSLPLQTFEELRELVGHDKAALQRFRKCYRHASALRLPGFDPDTADIMDTMVIGAHRAPTPLLGRNPPLTPQRVTALRDLLAEHGGKIDVERRVALSLSLQRGPNASPLALSRDDLSEDASGPEFGIPRHKKRLEHERAELHQLPVGTKLAADIRALMKRNAELAARMIWPDGTLGLPDGVALPLFIRSAPKPSHADVGCPVREYALHKSGDQVTQLIRAGAADLCLLGGLPIIDVTARIGRRTVATEAQRQGFPPEVIARLHDHRSTRNVPRYAAEGLEVLDQVERSFGDRIREICASYVTVAVGLAEGTGDVVLQLLRKSSFRSD